ncbi:hypothetical protein P692DRAFT_20759331 [Suillus brevipes Sb2]|nr:hypothetical protein P692DRAFT_20759331 [Suillus brevipes Sb2]
MAPLRALSRLTFMFTFLSRLSSACPVLSLYDPLVLYTMNPSLFIATTTTAQLSALFAASSLEKILRDLHATSASSLPPIACL